MKQSARELQIIGSLTSQDFEKVTSFDTIDQCMEAVRLNHVGTIKDMPKPHKVNGLIFFRTKGEGISPFFTVKTDNDGKLELSEMTYASYCKYGF